MRIALVMPALNEEQALAEHLPHALAFADEVVVSDGGSKDGTRELAQRLGAHVVVGPPGRGSQLNRGAAAVHDADVLLFLHADTTLPDDARAQIENALETSDGARSAEGGAFYVRFAEPSRALSLGTRIVNVRTRWTRLPLGDQGQFVRRDVFKEMGGFRDWPILEDLDFARRLRGRKKMVLLRGPITTSGRRYLERGISKTIATNWFIWLLFLFGVSPHKLARLYRHIR